MNTVTLELKYTSNKKMKKEISIDDFTFINIERTKLASNDVPITRSLYHFYTIKCESKKILGMQSIRSSKTTSKGHERILTDREKKVCLTYIPESACIMHLQIKEPTTGHYVILAILYVKQE